MKTTTIPAVDTNRTATINLIQWERGKYTATVDYKGAHSADFTNRRAALAWIRSKVGRISLSRAS